MADGRCFWSCLFLHCCDESAKATWFEQKRSEQGFPDEQRCVIEREAVYKFSSQMLQAAQDDAQSETILSNCMFICCCF